MGILEISDSDLDVFNAALAKIGVRAVSSFLENSQAARVGNAIYADELERILTTYPWRFAYAQRAMTRLDIVAPSPWETMWDKGNLLVVRNVFENDSQTQFEVFADGVATRTSAAFDGTVYGSGTIAVEPERWAGYFRSAFIDHLAGELAMPILQDERIAQAMYNKAEVSMRTAKSRDAQNRTPTRLDTQLFVRARRRGWRG